MQPLYERMVLKSTLSTVEYLPGCVHASFHRKIESRETLVKDKYPKHQAGQISGVV